jgi:hypothetical protein
MGGFLSHPAKHFPNRFGNNKFLKDHPYALPCLASSAISFVIFIVVALFLREVGYYGHPGSKTSLNILSRFLLTLLDHWLQE